jgi:DNA invertase Pin-like site-specific DNA recombinase
MLSLSSLSVKTVAVIYDRVSTKGQIASFDTHLPILRNAVANSGITFDEIHEITEIGSAFNHHESLRLYSVLDQKNIHVFIYDTSRLSRDLEAAGTIIKKIQANKIIVHVAGVEQPYVCDTKENIRRLFMGMVEAYDEAIIISERSKRYHQAQKTIRASRPIPPPTASVELLTVLKMMLEGCDIGDFYEAFNRVTPLGQTEARIGGDLYVLEGRDRKEMQSIQKGDFTMKDILRMFNQWEITESGTKKFTMASLCRLVNHFFGEVIPSMEMEMEMDEDEDED